MYPKEQRQQAIDLLIEYDHNAKLVINELGYPATEQTLLDWFKTYCRDGAMGRKKNDNSVKYY